jgi:hypothetical protein
VSEKRQRLSYMLRLWQAESEGTLVWRASLESASASVRGLASAGIGSGRPGERRGFASLAELYVFLEQRTAALNEQRPRSPGCDDESARPSVHPGAFLDERGDPIDDSSPSFSMGRDRPGISDSAVVGSSRKGTR